MTLDGAPIATDALSVQRNPNETGTYILSWSAPAVVVQQVLSVSFPAGLFDSPVRGRLAAFEHEVTLNDCARPHINWGFLVTSSNYECADEACTNMSAASIVLAVGFSEAVSGSGGGAATSSDIEVFIEGGTATVVATFDVVEKSERRNRRLEGDGDRTRMAIGVVTSNGGTGGEVVKFRAKAGSIRDAGAWAVGHGDADVVSAFGSMAQPYTSLKLGADDVGIELAGTGDGGSPSVSLNFSGDMMLVGIVLGCVAGLVCMCSSFLCLRRRRSIKLQKRRAALRKGKDGFRETRLEVCSATDDDDLLPGSAAAMAIAAQLDWLRPPLGAVGSPSRSPTSMSKSNSTAALISSDLHETGRWIDALSHSYVSTLNDARPRCDLPTRVRKAAREAHLELERAPATDDLTALESLAELLDAEPVQVPLDLLVAASSLDRSADEATADFGEAEMVARLKSVIDSSSPLSRAIADALGWDMAGSGGSGDVRQQLCCLIRDFEKYALALKTAEPLVSLCIEAFEATGVTRTAHTDAESLALVRAVALMHARLGRSQVEAENRLLSELSLSHRMHDDGDRAGRTAQDAIAASRRIHHTLILPQLKAKGVKTFQGSLPPPQEIQPQECNAAPHEHPPLISGLYGSSRMDVGGFNFKVSCREEMPSESNLQPTVRFDDNLGSCRELDHRVSVHMSERAADDDLNARQEALCFGGSHKHLDPRLLAPPPAAHHPIPGGRAVTEALASNHEWADASEPAPLAAKPEMHEASSTEMMRERALRASGAKSLRLPPTSRLSPLASPTRSVPIMDEDELDLAAPVVAHREAPSVPAFTKRPSAARAAPEPPEGSRTLNGSLALPRIKSDARPSSAFMSERKQLPESRIDGMLTSLFAACDGDSPRAPKPSRGGSKVMPTSHTSSDGRQADRDRACSARCASDSR